MNPLSFLAWLKFQPLYGIYGSLGSQACKAISQSSAIAPSSSGDDKMRTASHFAFDYLKQATSRLASHLTVVSSSWLLAPMITRMQDASIMSIKPSLSIAECEHIKESRPPPPRVQTRDSPLELQQIVLQQQDYNNYQSRFQIQTIFYHTNGIYHI